MAISGFVKRVRDIMWMDAGVNGDAQRIEQLVWILFLKVYDVKEDSWEFEDDDYQSIIPEECRWRNWAGDNTLTGDRLLDFVNNKLFPTLKKLNVSSDTPLQKAIVKATFEDANNYMKDGIYLRQVIDIVNEIDLDDTAESHAFGDIYESILKELQSAGSSGEFYTPRAVTEFMAQMMEPKIGEKMADFACGTGGFLVSWLNQLEKQIVTTADYEAVNNSIFAMEKKPFPYLLCITNMLLHGLNNPNINHGNSLAKNLLDYTEDDKFDKIIMNPPYGGKENAAIKGYFPDDLASSETADLFMSVIMYRLKRKGRAAVILPDGFLFGNDNAKTSIKKKLLADFNLHTIIRMPGSVFAPYTSITTNILFFDNTHATEDVWFYRLDMPEGYKHFSKMKPMKLEHFQPVMDWWGNREEITVDKWPKAKKYTAEVIAAGGYNLDLCGFPHEEEEILPPDELIADYLGQMELLEESIKDVSIYLKENLLKVKSSSEAFDADIIAGACTKISELSMAFPGKLKNSLLQMAVQGKLTEQRPEDGNAADLLKEIQAEKAKLMKEGKIKKEKPLPEISEDEIPFEIPKNWCWCRLGNVGAFERGSGIKREQTLSSGYPCVRYGELYTTYKGVFAKTKSFTSEEVYCSSHKGNYNDIFMALTGENKVDIATAVVYQGEEQIAYGGDMTKFSHLSMDSLYLMYMLNSPFVGEQKKILATGNIIVHISNDKLATMMIPLPPLAEQKRIVAKLEKLLPLCDTLAKAQQ